MFIGGETWIIADCQPCCANPALLMSTQPPQNTLSRRFGGLMCLLLLLAMSVFWLISHFYVQDVLQQQADRLGRTLATATAEDAAMLMLANDPAGLQRMLEGLAAEANIAEVTLLDVEGQMIASAAAPPSAASAQAPVQSQGQTVPHTLLPLPFSLSRLSRVYEAPLWLGDSAAGRVRVSLDLSYMEVHLMNKLFLVIAATALMMILAVSLSRSHFNNLVSFPLQTLRFALGRIRHGKIEQCPEPGQDNELSSTIRQFNATAEFLARNTVFNALYRRRAADTNIDMSLPGEEAVTLMCVNLANYQYLASTLPNEQLALLLNKYYFLLGRTVQLYSGRVIYCTEGELLVNFGMNAVAEEQAFHAVCAGQLFLRLLASINLLGQKRVAARYHLAIHSGQAISGLYSPVTGGNDILTGRTVDVAWQICDECPDNRLLISKDCYERAGAGSRVDADPFSKREEDGLVMTYLVREPMADYRLLLERQAGQLLHIYDKAR